MNKKLILAKYIAILVFKSVWLFFSVLFLWAAFAANSGGFGGWLLMGGICMLPLIIDLIREMIKQGKQGAIEGANTYYVRDCGSFLTISNAPGLGAFKGVIVAIIAYLLAGPILLILKMLLVIIKPISSSRRCHLH